VVVGAVGALLAALIYAWGRDGGPPAIAADGGAGSLSQTGTVEVTYVANEGVLLSAGDRKVLIDGLHREYRSYPHLPEPHRGKLETAQPPFDGIDLILVSHVHLDHFHAEAIGRYLTHNPKAMLVSSEQVVGELEKGFADYASIGSRVTAVTPPLTHKVTMTAGGIEIEVLGVGHGSGRHRTIQNLGHLVRLGGKTLLHLGDAEADPGIFAKLNLDAAPIDVAFLPMWLLTGTDGPAIVKEHIKPRHIVAVHMPADGAERAAREIKELFPQADAFTVLLERRVY
jgi:L-ascorbate metabolism protein UlaG (beta-lactamase superfamily)